MVQLVEDFGFEGVFPIPSMFPSAWPRDRVSDFSQLFGVFVLFFLFLHLLRLNLMDNSENRRWDELHRDALGLILRKLSLEEVLVVIPCVCKSWRDTVLGPYFWEEIDILDWSENQQPDIVNRMSLMLMTSTTGTLRKLCVSGLPNHSSLFLIAQLGHALHTLRLPRSKITDSIVEYVVPRLSVLTFVDLSFCENIGAPALEAIGKHCVHLTVFRRIMHPLFYSYQDYLDNETIFPFSWSRQNAEALAVASTMHKLKHIEIVNFNINTESVLKILQNCTELEYLDMRGCWEVIRDEKLKKFLRVKLVGPLTVSEINEHGDISCFFNDFGYFVDGFYKQLKTPSFL